MKPAVYEGSEPYIFVSYAHRDAESVFEVLRELEERGYRLWYDDGIAPGSEWPEDIAQHLDGSAMVIAFITPNSMKSQNCRREINFSLSREKPFLSVALEKTAMPLGMEMQLSAQQSVLRYNFDTWQGFIKKILTCPGIAPCRAELQQPEAVPAPEPAPEPAATTVPLSKPQEATTADVSPTQVRARAAEPVEEPAAEPVEEPAAERQEEPTEKKGAPWMPYALVAVALVAVIAVVVGIMGRSSTSGGGGTQESADSGSVSEGTGMQQADLEKLAAASDLESLDLSNCDLSACDLSAVTFATTEPFNLILDGATGIDDFSFLANLHLSGLHAAGCAGFDNAALAFVDVSELDELDVSDTDVTDLSHLAGDGSGGDVPLNLVRFANTAVSDLSPLSQLQNLKLVDGSNTKVTSIDALAALTGLEELSFDGCALGAVDEAFCSLRLARLSVAHAQVSDLSGFSDCTVLQELDLRDNPELDSMDWLNEQNCDTLSALDLSQTDLNANDLKWVATCASLKELRLDGLPLSNLSFLEGLKKLELLSAINCKLEDISGLKDCTDLAGIYLSFNALTDVEAFSGLSFANPVNLDLTHNGITSLEKLPVGAYRNLMLYDNADDVVTTLPQGLTASLLTASYFDGIEDTSLGEVAPNLYVVDCPKDQMVKLEDAFGDDLKLTTADELWDLYATDGFASPFEEDMSYLASVGTGETERLIIGISGVSDMTPFEISIG